MDSKTRDNLYAKYLPKIVENIKENKQQFQEKLQFFSTLQIDDLFVYSMSLGYTSVYIPCFECAPSYVLSMIESFIQFNNGIPEAKTASRTGNYLTYLYPKGLLLLLIKPTNAYIPEIEDTISPFIKYEEIRIKVKNEIDCIFLSGISDMIVEYLVLSTKGLKDSLED